MFEPPPLPPDSLYAGNYCEENIYFLAQALTRQPSDMNVWDITVVFISNPSKSVALWNQKLAGTAEKAVIWDYHVVLLLRARRNGQFAELAQAESNVPQSWIYDFDTLLPKPCHWKDYLSLTFPLIGEVLAEYKSIFRVIPSDVFLQHFASDRSHMLVPMTSPMYDPISPYYSPLPPWPAIWGHQAEQPNNLMSSFVAMDDNFNTGIGVVQGMEIFEKWCGGE